MCQLAFINLRTLYANRRGGCGSITAHDPHGRDGSAGSNRCWGRWRIFGSMRMTTTADFIEPKQGGVGLPGGFNNRLVVRRRTGLQSRPWWSCDGRRFEKQLIKSRIIPPKGEASRTRAMHAEIQRQQTRTADMDRTYGDAADADPVPKDTHPTASQAAYNSPRWSPGFSRYSQTG